MLRIGHFFTMLGIGHIYTMLRSSHIYTMLRISHIYTMLRIRHIYTMLRSRPILLDAPHQVVALQGSALVWGDQLDLSGLHFEGDIRQGRQFRPGDGLQGANRA